MKYLAALKSAHATVSGPQAVSLLYALRSIGALHPHLLTSYRAWLEGLLKDAAQREQAQAVLDLMAGRT